MFIMWRGCSESVFCTFQRNKVNSGNHRISTASSHGSSDSSDSMSGSKADVRVLEGGAGGPVIQLSQEVGARLSLSS